jgi:hypothetical protein
MRRFCNYFVTLFNQEKIIPFGQFINATLLNEVKQRVKIQMNNYAQNGEVTDFDPMVEGNLNTETEKESDSQDQTHRDPKAENATQNS